MSNWWASSKKLPEAMMDTWAVAQLIRALHLVQWRGVFGNEVTVLMGSKRNKAKLVPHHYRREDDPA
jgi:hypothetical protein